MIRLDDWPARLDEAVAIGNMRAFEWGKHDCLMFAADCVRAMTGVDLMAEWRGSYDSHDAAYANLDKGYRGSLAYAVSSKLERHASPFFAQRGDVVLHDNTAGVLGLGVCLGRMFAAPAEVKGLVYFPLSKAIAAWKV